ncbi:hypothetical protein [Hafnia paralvei]|uniref:hypothetical protein n=1 Tax=Hafnia paralvei TaxID=546367 RepID=UPI0038D2053F
MTKLTTELLEKFVSDIKTDGMCDITDSQVESALIRLLAYEQAAKEVACWGVTGHRGHIYPLSPHTARMDGFPLYAAPVLPKQPEHSRQHFESLCNQFWNWAEFDEINQDEEPRLEWNGSNYTHRVTAALWKMYQAAPAQPVIPRELRSFVTDADIAALHRFAECCDDPESGGHDLEKEQVQRLEKIGALQRSGRIGYITDFGDYLISAAPAKESK